MKPEWGTKRICLKCGAHFYDLKKPEFECVTCGIAYVTDDFAPGRGKSSEGSAKKEARKKVEETLILEEPVEDVEPEIDPDSLIESTDDLDDEDVHSVISHEEEEGE